MLPEGFELYVRGKPLPSATPRVSVLKRGAISFNEAAFGALGSPTAVQLLFNLENQVIGIRSTSESHESAHRVRSQAGARSYVVGCQGFLQFYGIDFQRSRRFSARLVGNMLEVDLSHPSAAGTGE